MGNRDGLVCGQLNVDLTDRGRKEAEALRDRLRPENLDFDYCFTTSLSRASLTAQLAFPGQEFLIDDRLMETDTGHFSHIKLTEYLEKYEPKIVNHGEYPDLRFLGGESLAEVNTRVTSWLEELTHNVCQGTESSVLVVAHGGPIGLIMQNLFRIPIDIFNPFSLGNAALSEVEICLTGKRVRPTLKRFNF